MSEKLGIIHGGKSGGTELYINNVKQTQYKKCELLDYTTKFTNRGNKNPRSVASGVMERSIIAYLCSQMSLIAVLSSPSIVMFANAGIHTRSTPMGAR